MSDSAALLHEALALHKRGAYDEAERRYRELLEREPRHFDALHLLGVLARQRGRAQLAVGLIERALAVDAGQAIAWCNLGTAWQDLGAADRALVAFERAIALDPGYALAHNNRGNACRNLGAYDEALAAYDAALHVRPDADVWSNRGSVLYAQGRFEEGLQSIERALRLDAKHASAWCNRGMTLQKLERYGEAVESYQRALDLRPDHAEAWLYRGNALRLLGRFDDAVASYRRARECGADAELTAYFLAALGKGDAPTVSPASYVKDLFDRYASHFDAHLVDVLHYRTPQLLHDALRQASITPQGACIDLGCGTGLAGVLLRPQVAALHGVDLSQAMLDRAAERGIYDSLACEELTAHLARHTAAFDLAIAADVLVYIGDLTNLMAAVRRALRPGGAFAFSVEETMDGPYTLQRSQRYAHASSYVERVAREADFKLEHLARVVLREDEGEEVGGLVVVLAAGR